MKRAFYLAFFLAVVAAIAGGALTFANDIRKIRLPQTRRQRKKRIWKSFIRVPILKS